MKNLFTLNEFRVVNADILRHFGNAGDETCGMFLISSPIDGRGMKVIASSDCGWDHVSVSRPNRCPNWPEMAHVKSLFFEEDECVMQLHVPTADHVNDHPYCLHLWRPHDAEIPRPPSWMVGGCSKEEALQKLKEHGNPLNEAAEA